MIKTGELLLTIDAELDRLLLAGDCHIACRRGESERPPHCEPDPGTIRMTPQ